MRQPPEQSPSRGEKHHAAHEQIAEKNAPRNEHVARYDQHHQNCTGNLHIAKLPRLEP